MVSCRNKGHVIDRLGQPDHELGYTKRALESRLGGGEMTALDTWMIGQTMALDETEGPVYYTWDVQRFFGVVPGREVFD